MRLATVQPIRWKLIALLSVGAIFLASQAHSAQGPATVRQIDFNREIRPILSDKCWACHGKVCM